MFKKFFTYILILLMVCSANPHEIKAFGHASDRISLSWPGTAVDHTIIFMTTENIPPSGRLVITPESGFFMIENGFGYADVDLATSTGPNDLFTERELGATSSVLLDGVTAAASSTDGYVSIEINSTFGIDAGTYVRIKLGEIASYGDFGSRQIINPAATGSYGILAESFDSAGNFIERAKMMVAMVMPVAMSATQIKIRANGTPAGFLGFGTTQTIMSLTTNYAADCRYISASGTPYASMVDAFSYTGLYYHSIVLTGLVSGHQYDYYVRCRDAFDVDDDTDYLISFAVAGREDTGGDEAGTPGPGGGGSGGGSGGGMGQQQGRGQGNLLPFPPLPDMPGVALSGYSYPLSEVSILKDGLQEGVVNANSLAQFGAFLPDLTKGVYTFSVWGMDSDGRRSTTFSTTFWIDDGTQTTVTNIILPPTIAVAAKSIPGGGQFEVMGQSSPEGAVEIWLYPANRTSLKDDEIVKQETVAASDGRWTAYVPTVGLEEGPYKIKARVNLDTVGMSDFGVLLDVMIGASSDEPIGCPGGDLNGDGRVNITDFSILLYWWGTDNACSDQNHDGTVNLTDFSIMMFYWTG